MKLSVLLADQDRGARTAMRSALEAHGHGVVAVSDAQEMLACLSEGVFHIALHDAQLRSSSTADVLRYARDHSPGTAVVLLAAQSDMSEVVDALRAGAADCITKPLDMEKFVHRIQALGERVRLQNELREARKSLVATGSSSKLIGRSPLMLSLMERIKTIGPSEASVVIVGESGTGKELVARALHEASGRASGPFVAINCAAWPETLIEAELFGHERGAFTGAVQRREGRFQAASGGTLLLDELGEMPLGVQAKLLRVLQEGTIEPLGSNRPLPFDVRLICATHRNLKAMILEHTFREDLYYRVNVVEVPVPPLRSRRGDLPLLVSHFYRNFSRTGNEPVFEPRAWAALMRHDFPGNVRELEHAIHHAVILSRGAPIDESHLPEAMRLEQGDGSEAPSNVRPLTEAMMYCERQLLLSALHATQGVRKKAADVLGISRKTLWEKLKAHRITDNHISGRQILGRHV